MWPSPKFVLMSHPLAACHMLVPIARIMQMLAVGWKVECTSEGLAQSNPSHGAILH